MLVFRCSSRRALFTKNVFTLYLGVLTPIHSIAFVCGFAAILARSDKSEFPNFSRVVSPDDARGQVGALVSTLGLFGWRRVTILSTDTPYAKDLATTFRGIWQGSVAYAATVEMKLDGGGIDPASARKALRSAPHDDPANNAKVVVVLAHDQDAYPLLRLAHDHFPPDTSFVGPDWTGRALPPDVAEWLPDTPGYIGIVPHRQRPSDSPPYRQFLELGGARLRDWADTLTFDDAWGEWRLPGYPAEHTVDAIVALVRAFAQTPPDSWTDGAAITRKLREQDFRGLSGRVAFTAEGDRADPQFSVVNLQRAADGFHAWVQVGTAAPGGAARLASPGVRGVCFAGVGCGLAAPPRDAPPVPLAPHVVWVPIVLVALCVAFGVVFAQYRARKIRASRLAKARLTAQEAQLDEFREAVVGMCAAEAQHVPKMGRGSSSTSSPPSVPSGSPSFVDMVTDKAATSPHQGLPPPVPPPLPPRIQWCWQETKSYMDKWSDSEIEGDRKDSWIKYDPAVNVYIEDMHNRQQGIGTYQVNADYTIDFGAMAQIKTKTAFRRDVKRVVEAQPRQQPEQAPNTVSPFAALAACDCSATSSLANSPPAEIVKEPQMVLVPGDIVQISKKRKDGWAYGSKLHAEDEPLGRRLVQVALSAATTSVCRGSSTKAVRRGSGIIASITRSLNDEGEDEGDADDNIAIITDNHGWFPIAVTRVPNTDDLTTLRKTLGEANNLAAPDTWDKIVDPSVVQKSAPLNPSSQEYGDVSASFLTTLPASTRIVSIQRIQNVAMYQSYIVKRKNIIERDQTLRRADNSASFAQGLARFERRWLWHGTNADTVDKIVQQGFNRSFCGKNATVYGKGVYFARDASYSSCDTYSPEDSARRKYILACSVVVGEFCRGRTNARTPDLRDAAKNILYDSTVDNPSRPSLYVTYHDAQCYPEYLIVFKK